MNKSLVIFVTTPVIKRDLKIYGVDYYNTQGIDVYFFSFWNWFSKGIKHKKDISYEKEIEIDSFKSCYQNVKKFHQKGAVFLSDVCYSPKHFYLYLVLSVLRINYNFVDNWYAIRPPKNEIWLKTSLKKIWRIKNTLKYYCFRFLLKKPTLIFMPNKKSFHSIAMKGQQSKIIPYSSFNYDNFLESNTNAETQSLPTNYGVFIDQYLTDLPDFARTGTKSPLTNKYYTSLNQFFEQFQKETNKDILIACHPRRQNESADQFKGYKSMFYKTYELVKSADIVFAHYSNSIYWAILLNKPILFISTNELQDTHVLRIIESAAREVNQKVINIDTDKLADIKQLIYTSEIRRTFIENHIVYDPSEKRKTYQIICKNLF